MISTVAVAADTSRKVFGPTLHASGAIFDVLGTRLVAGRRFSTTDSGVVIISQSAADRLFRGMSPLGQRVIMFGNESMTIVGVVADMHYTARKGSPEPQIYLPINRSGLSYLVATLRTDGDPRTLEHTLRDVVRTLDPQQPVTSISTMDALLADSVKEPRTQTFMLGALGLLAFIMTCIGVYGVVSYSVTQRTREIGIRIALGADMQSVLGLVVAQGTALAGVGTVVGVAISLWATRLVRTSLYEVSALDPWVFVAVTAGVLVVTALASYLPARRAARIDPMAALRTE
jgi:putative ABC transport system permease protein